MWKWSKPTLFKSKQSGMTLVEVLATLVLSSLVILLIWTTVSISMKHNIVENKKLRLQQEANYIITEVQRFHRICEKYTITTTIGEFIIDDCIKSTGVSNKVISSEFDYSGTGLVGKTIYPKSDDFKFTLIVKDKSNQKLYVEVETILSRYKTE